MHKVIGLILLASTLAYGIHALAPSTADREEQVAAVTRIIAQGSISEPETVAAEQPGLRQPISQGPPLPAFASPSMTVTTVSPLAAPLHAPQSLPDPLGPNSATGALATPAVEPGSAAALSRDPLEAATWQTGVTLAASVPPASTQTTKAATLASTGASKQLARQIQAELKRLGCYAGNLDGSWGPASRDAMANFIAAVNASLPTTEPDVIQLTLLKGHSGSVCGLTCAPGELATGGRCVRGAVLASATDPTVKARPESRPDIGDSWRQPAIASPSRTTALVRPAAPPLPGRMSIGGPRSDGTNREVDANYSPAPAPVTGERLPWADDRANSAASAQDPGYGAIASRHLAALETERGRNVPAAPRSAASYLPDDSIAASAGGSGVKRAARPAKPRAANPPRAAVKRQIQRRKYATRSIQSIFLHPLGRM